MWRAPLWLDRPSPGAYGIMAVADPEFNPTTFDGYSDTFSSSKIGKRIFHSFNQSRLFGRSIMAMIRRRKRRLSFLVILTSVTTMTLSLSSSLPLVIANSLHFDLSLCSFC